MTVKKSLEELNFENESIFKKNLNPFEKTDVTIKIVDNILMFSSESSKS